jgi:hypothetical protein
MNIVNIIPLFTLILTHGIQQGESLHSTALNKICIYICITYVCFVRRKFNRGFSGS